MDIMSKSLLFESVLVLAVWQLVLLHSFTNDLDNMESWTVIRLFNISVTWILPVLALGNVKEICVSISVYTIVMLVVVSCDNHPDSFLSIWKNRNTFTFQN
jgi:hypothetical protein